MTPLANPRRRLRATNWRHRLRGWHHRLLNRNLPDGEMQFVNGPRLRIHPKARWAFEFMTMHDPEMVAEMRNFLALTRDRRCFVDVGAHYGIFSLVFASRPGGVAHAVEPSPGALGILRHHLDINPTLDVRVCAAAVGAVNGTLSVEEGDNDHVLSGTGAGDSALVVPVLPLDELVERDRIRPDAVKIDVEGMEVDVLAGAQRTLAQHRPLLFLEVHPAEVAAAGHSVAGIDSLLRAAGFDLQDLRGDPITDLVGFCGQNVRRLVAVPT